MAARGHVVWLAYEPAARVSEAELLAAYGLTPLPTLHLRRLPQGRTAASLAFRAYFLEWVARTRGRGVVLARSKRYAREALRLGARAFTLVLEVHEVDSLLAAEAGRASQEIYKLESHVLSRAAGVVANAPGTLRALASVHPLPPAIALHNATAPQRVRLPRADGVGVGYVGSALPYKGMSELARAARIRQRPIHLVGPNPRAEVLALVRESDGFLRWEAGIPFTQVPDRLNAFRALVLPLSPGLFGEALTSPLKLWDYLASGTPVVGADTPALREAAGCAYHPYSPGDAEQLAAAIDAVERDEALRARLLAAAPIRTWAQRAAELDAFVAGLL